MARRAVDILATAPRFTAADAAAMDARFAGVETSAALRELLTGELRGRVGLVSSFGAESAVLLHLVAAIDRTIPVIFLNTQKIFDQTRAYRDALVERLGLPDLRVIRPDPHELARDATGLRWSYDPDGCCEIRKVRPLRRALAGFDAWISGRKAFQAKGRADLPRFEADEGRLKINALVDWDAGRLEAYFAAHALPRHPLVAEGYASIGCSPCTSRVQPGEDPRAGRWRGWDKTECGIHRPGGTSPDDAGDLPPGYQPAF